MPLNITDGATTPKPDGIEFLNEYAGHVETLYETGSRPLTAVGGTGDVVTATMAVDLTAAGLVDGLCVSITWGAANTGPVTLAINGGSAIPVVDAAGAALTPDTLAADLTSILRYTAGEWRIMSSLGTAGTGSGPSFETITASVTWDRPTGYADDTMVRIQLWGAGGGGGRSGVANFGAGGGGGGGYAERWMRIADIPTSVLVTLGAGGTGATTNTSGGVGGNSTFGSLLTAYGGGGGAGGTSATQAAGGGGGGENGAGTSGAVNVGGTGGTVGGGGGAPTTGPRGNALTIHGGGGGGASQTVTGGDSVWGGAGGGGGSAGTTAAGVSKYGGNGGAGAVGTAVGSPGVAPGGGGGGCGNASGAGAGGNGARGECRITIFG